jgi:predicted Fe-Mo cluster-binding NifX family protein
MKIAMCCERPDQESKISLRLGRAAQVAIYDDREDSWQFAENSQNLNAAQGAGIQTAQNIVNSGAEILLAANAGPKAMRVLQASDVEVYRALPDMTLSECVEMFKTAKLEKLEAANVEGHWV